jgi:hypothetical protein
VGTCAKWDGQRAPLAVAIVRVQPSKPTKHHVDTRSLCASRALRRHLYHFFVLLYIIKLITLKLNKLCRTRNADPQSGANLSMKSNNTTASSSYTLAEKRRRTRSTPPPHVIWTPYAADTENRSIAIHSHLSMLQPFCSRPGLGRLPFSP